MGPEEVGLEREGRLAFASGRILVWRKLGAMCLPSSGLLTARALVAQ